MIHLFSRRLGGIFFTRPTNLLSVDRHILWLIPIVFFVFFTAPPADASDYGVEPGTAQHNVLATAAEIRDSEVLKFLLGQPGEDTIMLGMWSYHFVDDDDSYQTTNDLLAFSYKGYYAGTFKNSHNDQTWSLGFERDVYRTELNFLSVSIGYRAGIMYGYETMQIFDTKLFPLFQVYTNLVYKHAGVQLTWAGSVLTAGFVITF